MPYVVMPYVIMAYIVRWYPQRERSLVYGMLVRFRLAPADTLDACRRLCRLDHLKISMSAIATAVVIEN